MASLAEMERKLTVERTCAALEVARQLGRKPKMTDSKIESAKKLLAVEHPFRVIKGSSQKTEKIVRLASNRQVEAIDQMQLRQETSK